MIKQEQIRQRVVSGTLTKNSISRRNNHQLCLMLWQSLVNYALRIVHWAWKHGGH